MKQIHGVIFDFNGVLFWDTHLHELAYNQYAKKLRGAEFTDDEIMHILHGRTNSDILEYLLGHPLSPEETKTHTNNKESIYREMCLSIGDEFRLSPGAIEFLDYLVAHSIPHTIATASEGGNVKFFFEHLELSKWFEFDNVVYDDGSFKGKPQPDIYLKAAAKLGLDPTDCLVIEDARSGMASAHAAGIGEIVALGPEDKQAELAGVPGVTQTIVDFREAVATWGPNLTR